MKNFSLLLIFLFSARSFSSIGQPSDISYTRKDLKNAQLFSSLIKNLESNKLNIKKLKKYNVLYKRDTHLNIKPFQKKIKKIIHSRNTEDIAKNCLKNISFNENFINLETQEALKNYCQKRFFSLLKKKRTIKYLSKKESQYLANILPNNLYSRSILKIVQNMKKNSTAFYQINDLILEASIQKNKIPYKSLLNLLKLTPEYISFIQTGKRNNFSEKIIFNEELTSFSKKIKMYLHRSQRIEAISHFEQMKSFHLQNFDLISKRHAHKILAKTCKNFKKEKIKGLVIDCFKYAISSLRPNLKDDLYFQLMWNYIDQKEFSKLLVFVEKHHFFSRFELLSTKNKFWFTYALYQNNNLKHAEHFFKKIIDKDSFSFYSIRSYSFLRKLGATNKSYWAFITPPNSKLKEFPHTTKSLSEQKQLKLWIKIKANKLLSDHVKYLLSKSKSFSNNKGHYYLSTFLTKNGKFLDSFRVVSSAINNPNFKPDQYFIKQLFPHPYFETIKKHSSKINPYFVLSLIRQESAFNKNAISRVGAAGLMQLMPATAKSLSRKVNYKNIFHPNMNIFLGTKYLNYLAKKFNGNLFYTLAAYNAGEGNLRKWIKRELGADDYLLEIEKIPFKETRKYVQLIYRNFFFYNLLNNQKSILTAPLEDVLKI
jgi:soluble lytic murein transglycosylase